MLIEENYCKTLANIHNFIGRLSSNSSRRLTAPTVFANLPELQINHFTGNLLDYKAFRQIFKATVIYNNSLLYEQRFTYLK